MATVTVVYPSDAKFDLDYYNKTHMPLVQEHWGKYGLKSWKVVQFDKTKSPYQIQAILEWGSPEEFEKAASGPEASTVLGDVPNFTDAQPVILPGKVVHSS